MHECDVPVRGGPLRVCRWPAEGPVVLAAHGITANALAFAPLAEALDGRADLIAPDLRGRAHSGRLPGPYGMSAHVADLLAVADHLRLDRFTLLGHSMGGFVAAALDSPRVRGVLLVDGGVPFPVPATADVDVLLDAVVGPAVRRLAMTFPVEGAYLDFFRAHPALRDAWSPAVEAYVRRDLTGEPPALRSSCAIEAVRADALDTLIGPALRLPPAAHLMWAPRGLQNEEQGLYDETRLAGLPISTEQVPDVNHYTILFDPAAVSRVADRLLTLT